MTVVLILIGIVTSAGTNDHAVGSVLFLIAFASIVFNSVSLFRHRQQQR
jgi:hypothetical protein